MKIYIVEAHFYDGESSWENLLSVRYTKELAEQDKKDYEDIRLNNQKLARNDYDAIWSRHNSLNQDDWYSEWSQKSYECERILYDDFTSVNISEVEIDKLLYDKKDLLYVPTL